MIVIRQSANSSVSAPVHRFWAAGPFRRAERLQKLKSVARRNRTAVPSGAEPLHALLRTAVSNNTNPKATAVKDLPMDISPLLEFAMAGSLQESGGMAEFCLTTRLGRVRFVR